MKNAVIYTRVSSDEQAKHGYGLGQQYANSMNFASQEGYNVIKTFSDEGISAKNLNRPGIQDLLDFCCKKENKVDAVIVWKLDRISRSTADYSATLKTFFRDNNIKLLTVVGINDEDNEIYRYIEIAFAEEERNQAKKRTKAAINQKVSLGRYPYPAPFGYKSVLIPGQKFKDLEIDEKAAIIVKKVFSLYLQGDSPSKITEKVYQLGLRNRNGNKFQKSSVETILRQRMYTGKFMYNGNLIEQTSYTPIIDEVTFEAVQQKLNAPNKTRQTHTSFVYNSCVKCGICGCALTGEIKKNKYIYYHCTGHKGGNCKKNSYIREEILNEALITILKQIVIPEYLVENVKAGLIKVHKQNHTDKQTEIKIINERLETINKAIKKAFECSIDDSNILKEHIEGWEQEKRNLQFKKEDLIKADESFYERSNSLINFCNSCYTYFLRGDVYEKRKLIHTLCSNFSYDGQKINIVLQPAFKSIVKLYQNKKILPELGSNQQPTG